MNNNNNDNNDNNNSNDVIIIKISQNSQENTCARVSFLTMLQA